MRRSPLAGFTMIELLIAVVVVAILAAIAIPSYSAYVVRGQRAAAKAALQQAAQYLERNYTTSGCYNYIAPTDCAGQSGAPTVVLPAALTSSPSEGPATYRVGVATFTPPSTSFSNGQYYQLSAAPCATSATACASGGTFSDPTCGALTLDNTGLQGIDTSGTGTQTPVTSGTTVSTCWQR
jgi:type IV pilus assembly protein PilE